MSRDKSGHNANHIRTHGRCSCDSAHWLEAKVPPPAVTALCALAMWWLAPVLPAFAVGIEYRIGIASTLAATGSVIALAGGWVFLLARTTIDPHRPDKASALVTGGIYRLTRNPMYLGLTLFLTAEATLLASPCLLAVPLLFVLYLTRFQIVPEERALLECFGAEYADYMARVRRWL